MVIVCKCQSLESLQDCLSCICLQAASADKAALQKLSMDRTTASYKLREGLAPYLEDLVLEELRTEPFSLNIDEATSKTNVKVLAVLVSYFSPSAKRIVVHHLGAMQLTSTTAQAMFEEIDNMFVSKGLDWNNLVSVLLDSCAVMRGTKGGLETLMRTKAPKLLDIDGDTCHHAHNAAKAFCHPFEGQVESYLRDLHTDFKWSDSLQNRYFEICMILNIKPTIPQRYVPHRWLSVLDVALDTLRLQDALTLFYYSFLSIADQKLYEDIVHQILDAHKVNDKGRATIKSHNVVLRKKFSSFTKEGKARKIRLAEACFKDRVITQAYLNIYISILPTLNEYVKFFQSTDSKMHRLHDKQHVLFNEFCSNFLTPESLQGTMPHQVDVRENLKSMKDMFLPDKVAQLFETREGACQKGQILSKLKEAYVACALVLQEKMPVNNPVLKGCAALDWSVRTSTTAQKHLIELGKLKTVKASSAKDSKADQKEFALIDLQDQEKFKKEVLSYTTSPEIQSPPPNSNTPIDVFWAGINAEKYPLLTSVAKKLLSAFHGPLVESSFSAMTRILNPGCSRLDVETYSATMGVRYFLSSKKMNAVEFFRKKNPSTDPIPKELTEKMRKAWVGNKDRQEENRQADMAKKSAIGAPELKPVSKTAEKQRLLNEARGVKWSFNENEDKKSAEKNKQKEKDSKKEKDERKIGQKKETGKEEKTGTKNENEKRTNLVKKGKETDTKKRKDEKGHDEKCDKGKKQKETDLQKKKEESKKHEDKKNLKRPMPHANIGHFFTKVSKKSTYDLLKPSSCELRK